MKLLKISYIRGSLLLVNKGESEEGEIRWGEHLLNCRKYNDKIEQPLER